MSTTLYRKYRPQKFSEIEGQEVIKTTLQNEIKAGKISHAYLFSGPRGIGKTTTARLMAKAINCENRKQGEYEPCNKCSSCLEIAGNRNLDLIEIDAASNRGINEIRELRDHARVAPTKSKYKVFVIDEAHQLTPEAFNALLKTLEEPPSHVIFILATTEIHKLPETIISRCQRFDFKKVNLKEIAEKLKVIAKKENIEIDHRVLEKIAGQSEGCIRDAETLLQQIFSLGDKKITYEEAEIFFPRSDINLIIDFVKNLISKKKEKTIFLINKLVEEGVDLKDFSSNLIEFLRKLMILKIDQEAKGIYYGLDKVKDEEIILLSKEIELKDLVRMINMFIQARRDLEYAEIPQLPLELAIIEISEGSKL
ncbi:MAG: DNA polymerase III subunit gamma/tau [Parcubacteria group bacterium Athens1014_10]|nr:MAG: DNA polymerase III subunit gamma/tau [Parcubacteria group bacterium Athens1014_10]TSD06094.1 MAG: DNA polymerase III subunit gamma/tau [Parcubacteria group bacterium Athens0714_12]